MYKFCVLPKIRQDCGRHQLVAERADPPEETIAASGKTAGEIIAAVCAERFDPAPSFQGCRFCDYADLCEGKEPGE
jgi:hypothetical protein